MIRRSLAVIALLSAAAAQAADALAARVVVFKRPLPYVNGVPVTPAVPSQLIAPPAGGFGDSLEAIRAAVVGRKDGSGVAVAEIQTTGAIGAEGVQIFIPSAGGAVSFRRDEAGIHVTLPQPGKPAVIPAKPSTSVFAGKDEMVYLAITPMPLDKLDHSVVVVNAVKPPGVLRRVEPKMPEAAQADRVGGSVMVQARIEPDGSVSSAAVLSAPRPDLGEAATAAVKQWRFAPTRSGGEPVAAYLNVTMYFQVR
jgi:TonB family protein